MWASGRGSYYLEWVISSSLPLLRLRVLDFLILDGGWLIPTTVFPPGVVCGGLPMTVVELLRGESVCCHLASMFVRLCVHMCCSTEYPFVAAVPAAVVPFGVDVFAVVVHSRRVLF